METIKQINIKNRTCYFYNGIIDIETFDSNMLKLVKKTYKKKNNNVKKILIFTILDTLQLKQLVMVMILIV